MSVTAADIGSSLISNPSFRLQFSGDKSGQETFDDPLSVTFAGSGGTAPTYTAVLKGTISISGATDYLLAAATAPFGSYSTGAAVSGVLKLKYLRIRHSSGSGNLLIARGAANGLAIFAAASDGITIGPTGLFEWYDRDGGITGVLTTTSNDKLTLTPSAGTVGAVILAAYGP
jgi:hypothetical protein